MNADALDTLRHLAARLGRSPSYLELLRELGHDPAGKPVQGVQDPGYPFHPGLASALLGPVESDGGLTALLQEKDLRESHPDFVRMREELVQQMLFGLELPSGGHSSSAPPRRRMPPTRKGGGVGMADSPLEDLS